MQRKKSSTWRLSVFFQDWKRQFLHDYETCYWLDKTRVDWRVEKGKIVFLDKNELFGKCYSFFSKRKHEDKRFWEKNSRICVIIVIRIS